VLIPLPPDTHRQPRRHDETKCNSELEGRSRIPSAVTGIPSPHAHLLDSVQSYWRFVRGNAIFPEQGAAGSGSVKPDLVYGDDFMPGKTGFFPMSHIAAIPPVGRLTLV
jgi:hypothetical protein